MKSSRIIFWLAVAAVLVGSVMVVLNGGEGEVSSTPGANLTIALNSSDHTKGTAGAPVQIVEYSDFQCPACRSYSPILKSVVAEFEDHVEFAYRHFPLRSIHPNAQTSAQAAEAAGMQGKFWEMHDMLFDGQTTWASMDAGDAVSEFMGYAKELGIDADKFLEDLNSSEAKDSVNDAYNSGVASKVQGTPTIYINGVEAKARSTEDLRSLIRSNLEK